MKRTWKEFLNFSTSFKKYVFTYVTDEDIKRTAVGEVLNSEDFNLNAARADTSISAGLYDTGIFGSVDMCRCGRTKTLGTCPYCKVTVKDKAAYENQYAYYDLKLPYSFSFKLKILLNLLHNQGFTLLDTPATDSSTQSEKLIQYIWSLSFERYKKVSKAIESEMVNDKFENEDMMVFRCYDPYEKENIYVKVSYITPKTDLQNIGLIGLSSLSPYLFNGSPLNYISNYINSVMYIKSPYLRPPKFAKQNGKVLVTLPSIHTYYKTAIELSKILREHLSTIKNSIDVATYLGILNIIHDRFIMNQDLLATSKKSTLRRSTAIRLDLTMRGNISPNNDLKLNEIGIPEGVMYLCLQHQIIEKLKQDDDYKIALNAEYYYTIRHPKAYKIMRDIVDLSCVLFQRSPVLFKHGVQAFVPVLISSNEAVIQMNPLVANPFNADYDGDQMLATLVSEAQLARRFLQKLSPEFVWFYDKGGAPLWVPAHEQLVGLTMASSITPSKKPQLFPSYKSLKESVMNGEVDIDEEVYIGKKRTSYGREKLQEILGQSLDNIIGEGNIINAKNIANIIAGISGKKNKLEILNELIDISNKFATKIGIDSPPAKNFYKLIDPKVKEIQEDNSLTDEQKFDKINKVIEDSLLEQIKKLPNTNFDMLVHNSGRMKMQQLRGLYARRVSMETGHLLVADSEIMSGLIEKDLYNAAYESRSVFRIKQNSVPVSGYSSRQLSVLLNNVTYSSKKAPIIGKVKIPNDFKGFDGRNIVSRNNKFTYYQSMVGRPFSDKIYSDEIRSNIFVKKILDNDNNLVDVESQLAMSFSMILIESISQAFLGLKYGASLAYVEAESADALFDGYIKEITDKYLIVMDDINREWKYILTEASSIPKQLKQGSSFRKGDKLIISNIIRKTEDDSMTISQFLGFQIAGGNTILEEKTISYAVEDCTIHYTDKYISFGSIRESINQKLIYKYPEGWKVGYADRICSGVLDLKALFKYIKDVDAFFIFYKEYHSIMSKRKGWGQIIEPELLEPIFAIISKSSGKSIKSMTRERTDILDSMYGGSPKQAFRQGTLNAPMKDKISQEFESTFITDILLRLNSPDFN